MKTWKKISLYIVCGLLCLVLVLGGLFIYGIAPSGPGGNPKVEASWKDNSNIIIKHHEKVRIFKAESKIKDIKIGYEQY
ncbi:MAG: hypothetical protein ABIK92_19895 [Pseudomonadota bacterium]